MIKASSKILLTLLMPMLLLCVSGCVEMEQRIVLRADGSAEFGFHYSIPMDSYAILQESQAIIQDWQDQGAGNAMQDLNWIFNEKLARKYFSSEDIRLKHYWITEKEGRRHVRLICEVRNLRRALRTGKLGDFRLVKTEEGNYRFSAELVRTQLMNVDSSQEDAELLREITRGMVIQLYVQTPSRILETSGAQLDGRRVVWRFDADEDWWFLFESPKVFVTFSGDGLEF
jgi:hypothetical protein